MASIIKTVEKNSPAYGKIMPGDRLISINSSEITDLLDYKFYSYDAKLSIFIVTAEGKRKRVKIKKPEGSDLGLEFDTWLMDKTRSCANRCVFCFIDQMPRGMRDSLYFKDDDARLSFLMGNYITLTNLTEREAQRIIDLKISPINISVHTTNPELRNVMLGNKNAGRGIEMMHRFAENGITMNCQIVLCPEINDGDELWRSMRDLADMYPAVASVSVVPVGLTKHREGLYPLKPFDRERARGAIALAEAFGEECLGKFGSSLFFCADELYLRAERDLPPDEHYEDYPQLENGVGMMRLLETEFLSAIETMESAKDEPFSIATGVSAAPFIEGLVQIARKKCNNLNAVVYPIKNDFFGHSIDVAGLITGGDLIAQLEGKDLGKRILIPKTMLRHGEGVFLDDITLEEAQKKLGVPVIPVEQDGFCLAEAMVNTVNN